MKKTIRIKENELVNMIDRMIKENIKEEETQEISKDVVDAINMFKTTNLFSKLTRIDRPEEKLDFMLEIAKVINLSSADSSKLPELISGLKTQSKLEPQKLKT
jgi:hypothetical protein